MGSQKKTIEAVHLLTPELIIEVYKDLQYFKNNQRDMTDQWKTFLANKLLESYQDATAEENNKEQNCPESSPPTEQED